MPAGDRTGPVGQGPRTGRALGYCSGNDAPGYATPGGAGMGWGMRNGGGRGPGRGFRGGGLGRGRAFQPNPPYGADPYWGGAQSKEQELKQLKRQAEDLKDAQKNIEKRIEELGKED